MSGKLLGRLVVAVVGVAITMGGPLRADDVATLKFERRSYNFSRVNSMYVHINGQKVGAVGNGDSAEYRFVPRVDGRNEIRAELYLPFEDNRFSRSIEFVAGPGGLVVVQSDLQDVDGKTAPALTVAVENAGRIPLQVQGVKLDSSTIERELSSEIIETLPGLKRTVKRSRTVEYSVTVTDRKDTDYSAKLDLKVISGEIHRKLSTELSKTKKESETIEQSIEIDGDKLPRVKLVWIEVVREGRATVKIGTTEQSLPFTYRENVELRVQKLDK